MTIKKLKKWLDKLLGRYQEPINKKSVMVSIKEYQNELKKHEPGSKKHLEIQSKINELRTLKEG